MSLPSKGTGFGAIVALTALCIQLLGMAWYGGTRNSQIDSLLKHADHDAVKIDMLSKEVTILREQVTTLQALVKELQAKLEAKKIVADVMPRLNVAGEAYKDSKNN